MYDPRFMTVVDSSQIAEIGWDKSTGKAYCRFVAKGRNAGSPGALYEYDDVPETVVQAIIDAPSPGQQFASTMRYGFSYRRIA